MSNKLYHDGIISQLVEDMDKQREINPIALVCDTYDNLRKADYNESEALALTEMICKYYIECRKLNDMQVTSYGDLDISKLA